MTIANHETWAVHERLSADADTHAYWMSAAADAADVPSLAQRLRSEITAEISVPPGLERTLLRAALERVEWDTLAALWLNQA